MRLYHTMLTISAGVRSALTRHFGAEDPSPSLDDLRARETDRLLGRMSLTELADLPLGPEPCFVDPEPSELNQRLMLGASRSAVCLN